MFTLNIATFLSPNYFALYQHLALKISAALQMDLNFVEGNDFSEFMEQDFDLAFACGYWYAQKSRAYEPLVAPILSNPKYHNLPVYYVDLIVRQDKQANNWRELKGQIFGFNEAQSFSGLRAFSHELKLSHQSFDYFGGLVQTRSHLNSIKEVIAGRIDCVTLDSTVLDYELKKKPEIAQAVKVIQSFGPYPAPPLLLNRKFDASVRGQLLNVLQNLSSEVLAKHGVKHYQEVNNSFYSKLVAIYQATKQED